MSEVRMGSETMEQREEPGGQPGKKRRSARTAAGFVLALFLTCAAAAGLLLLLAWVSYEMRFSAEVVRTGIMGLYVLPCLFGGRILKGLRMKPAPLWGTVVGIAFYGVLFALSFVQAGLKTEFTVGLLAPVLCAAGGLLGSLMGKKPQKS